MREYSIRKTASPRGNLLGFCRSFLDPVSKGAYMPIHTQRIHKLTNQGRGSNWFLSLMIGALLLVSCVVTIPLSTPAKARTASPPQSKSEKIARSVTIYRDSYGVPHVYGPTDASCVFGYIYAQAEDNFWQIEDTFIRAIGRASEVYGDRTLADDMLNRALEIPRLAKAEYDRVTGRERELSQALVDGLNYFLERNPQVKPRLITKFEPWQTFATTRYLVYQQFIYGKSGLKVDEIKTAVQALDSSAPAGSNSVSLNIPLNGF